MLIFPLIGLWAALQRDYALRNAAWHVVDIFAEMNESTGRRDGFTDPLDVHLRPGPEGIAPADMGSPEQATSDVKLVSRTLGASLVGVTAVDERWQYRTRFAGPDGQGGPQQPAPHRPPGCWHAINAALSVSGGGGSAGRNDKPNVIPESCTTVIIIAQEMDSPLLSTVPSALSGAATGLGYSHDAVVLLAVAQYLKNLGGRSIKRIPQPKA